MSPRREDKIKKTAANSRSATSQVAEIASAKNCESCCCSVCGSSEKLLRCGRCKLVFYCSKEHQVSDWKGHKKSCPPPPPPSVAATALSDDDAKSKKPAVKPVKPSSYYLDSGEAFSSSFTTSSTSTTTTTTTTTTIPADDDMNFHPVTISSRTQAQRHEIPGAYPYKTTLKLCADYPNNKEKKKVEEEEEVTLKSEKKPIQRSRNRSSRWWTLPITSEGSSEETIRDTAEQILNPVVDSRKMLTTTKTPPPTKVAGNNALSKSIKNGGGHNNNNNNNNNTRSSGKSEGGGGGFQHHQMRNEQRHSLYLSSLNVDKLKEMCENVVSDLNSYGVCVVDKFLGAEEGELVLDEVLNIRNAGLFADGQLVSTKAGANDSKNIRGDKTVWLDGKESNCPIIGSLISQVDALITRANKMENNGEMGTYTITGRTKAMVSCYPGQGEHYVKHVDNPNRDGRCITAIYYLNRDWDVKEDGGLLRIFPEGWKDQVADIEPIFDRIVFFWSDRRNPHEVQPSYKTRFAITLWYFDSRERNDAYKRYQKHNEKVCID